MSLIVKWRGKPVVVRQRTAKEIEEAKAVPVSDLRDQLARNANLPANAPATDENRAATGKEAWFVMIQICTHLGCVPLGQEGEYGGWFCPCHGSVYDTAGRIRQGPAPENMAIPGLRIHFRYHAAHRLNGAETRRWPGIRPTNRRIAVAKWLESRLPVLGLVHSSFVVYPTPRNLNYWWTFGAILTFMLAAQIVTGIVLAMHYVPADALAFNSVENIMRDVNYGWLLRYLHANGASMFFFAVYIHIFRGMYYGSYKAPREVLWILGVIIYLLMMATAFMGYVLPWGQMSFWAATVITNLFSAIPLVGEPIVTWLWGGFSVGRPTLNRFYSLHYLLPFMIAGVVLLHIWALHVPGNGNPTGVEVKDKQDTVPFHPYYTIKDVFGLSVFLILFAWLVFYHAELSRPPGQLHPGQPAADAGADRAGMVLPAVLRDPARHPEQAARRHRAVRLDRRPGLPAVARYLAGALGGLPADLPAVLLDLRAGRASASAISARSRRRVATSSRRAS